MSLVHHDSQFNGQRCFYDSLSTQDIFLAAFRNLSSAFFVFSPTFSWKQNAFMNLCYRLAFKEGASRFQTCDYPLSVLSSGGAALHVYSCFKRQELQALSCLTPSQNRICYGKFRDFYCATVGLDFCTFQREVPGHPLQTLQLWDVLTLRDRDLRNVCQPILLPDIPTDSSTSWFSGYDNSLACSILQSLSC